MTTSFDMTRRAARWASALVLLASLAQAGLVAAADDSAPPPDIVVIMLDDLGTDVMDALLAGGWLPNIQGHLLDRGVAFENAFVTNALCCPSRATFLTGQYSHNHRVYTNMAPDFRIGGMGWPGWLPSGTSPGRNAATLPTWLQAAGYATGYIGKYLNGYGLHAPAGVSDPQLYVPPGWDDWQGLIDPTTYKVYDYTMNDNGFLATYGSAEEDYQTDVLAARAATFLAEHGVDPAPLFLTVMPLAPHVEVRDLVGLLEGNEPRDAFALDIRPAPRHAHLIDGNEANGELPAFVAKPSFNEQDMSDKADCPSTIPPATITITRTPFCIPNLPLIRTAEDLPLIESQWKSMLAAMLAVDDLVGTVIDALDQAGRLDNAMIVLTSDNGWFFGEHRLTGKEHPFEEAIRVPLIVRGPGVAQGITTDRIVLNNDLAPTFADFAGALPPYSPDGMSLRPVLGDPLAAAWPRKTFLVEHWFQPSFLKYKGPTQFALRSIKTGQDYLYTTSHADPTQPGTITGREFYHMPTDPHQMKALKLPTHIEGILDQLVGFFRICQADSCHFFESF